MAILTKPTDLVRPVNRVDELIKKVETDFHNDKSFDPVTDVRMAPKRVIEVVGEYSAAERAEVCRQYMKAGWQSVTHMQLTKGDDKIARFTFTAKNTQ